MSEIHQSARRLTFGSMAEAYERWRPTYPDALVDDLMALQPHDVLDVGAGTGKAGRLLVARGCAVTGVEPDPRMAAICRRHGYLAVEESSFEAWEPDGRTFDLLVSGQAWHWVDPKTGPAKARQVLRPGGRIALFWNFGSHEPGLRRRLEPVYRRLAPDIADTTMALGNRDDEEERDNRTLSEAGFIVEGRHYAREVRLSRDHWLGYLSTCSDHILLEESQRAALFEQVGGVIDESGGALTWQLSTWLLLGARGVG